MQTIIQHVIRGYGPPVSAPVEFGIHYIDVVSGDMYLSRGKTDVSDWGAPLKAAMLDGEEGKTFGWNDGQTWYVLNVGVQKELIDQKDVVVGELLETYATTEVVRIEPTNQIAAVARDGATTTQLESYTNDQLKWIEGFPAGGEPNVVLAKLSDADRDAHWLAVSEGEVLQSDIQEQYQLLSSSVVGLLDNLNTIPSAPLHDDRAVLSRDGWSYPTGLFSRPKIIYPTDRTTVTPNTQLIIEDSSSVYSGKLIVRKIHITDAQNTVVFTATVGVQPQYEIPASVLLIGGEYKVSVCDSVGSYQQSDSVTIHVVPPSLTPSIVAIRGTKGPLPMEFAVDVVGVDDHVGTRWQVKDGNGGVLLERFDEALILSEEELPAGLYIIECAVMGNLSGWSDATQVVVEVVARIKWLVLYNASGVVAYNQSGDSFTKDASTLGELQTAATLDLQFDGDGSTALWIESSGTPLVRLYEKVNGQFIHMPQFAPANPPPQNFNSSYWTGIGLGGEGATAFLRTNRSPYTTSYNIHDINAISQNTTKPSVAGSATLNIIPDPVGNRYVYSAWNSPAHTLSWLNDDGSYTHKYLSTPSAPARASVSNNGEWLVCTNSNALCWVYRVTPTTTNHSVVTSSLPNYASEGGVDISDDGNIVVVLGYNAPRLRIFKRGENGVYTALSVPPNCQPTAYAGSTYYPRFNPTGDAIAVPSGAAPYVLMVRVDPVGETVTLASTTFDVPLTSAGRVRWVYN